MGLYNSWEEKLPEPLRSLRCIFCDSPIKPVNEAPSLDAFQYVCQNCNSKVVIEISGSLLADHLYERLQQDNPYKMELHTEIGNSKQKKFPLTVTKIAEHYHV